LSHNPGQYVVGNPDAADNFTIKLKKRDPVQKTHQKNGYWVIENKATLMRLTSPCFDSVRLAYQPLYYGLKPVH